MAPFTSGSDEERPFLEHWMCALENEEESGLRTDIRQLNISVERLQNLIGEMREQIARFMSRSEVESALSTRVQNDVYRSDMNSMIGRITHLERAPQRNAGMISLWISGVSGCLMFLMSIFALIVSILALFWQR